MCIKNVHEKKHGNCCEAAGILLWAFFPENSRAIHSKKLKNLAYETLNSTEEDRVGVCDVERDKKLHWAAVAAWMARQGGSWH